MDVKVGDYVQIKHNLKSGRRADGCHVTGDMADARGSICRVIEIRTKKSVKLETVIGKHTSSGYRWYHGWFTKASFIIIPKVGDEVMISPDLVSGKTYGNIPIIQSMAKQKGRVYTVVSVGDKSVQLNDGIGYHWPIESLCDVKSASEKEEHTYLTRNTGWIGKLKPGDRARIRADLREGSGQIREDGWNVTSSMMSLKGKWVTIKNELSLHPGKYKIEEDHWTWDVAAFDNVEFVGRKSPDSATAGTITHNGVTFRHGDHVLWTYNPVYETGKKEISGRIWYKGGVSFYICQNEKEGDAPAVGDKFGYKYSWVITPYMPLQKILHQSWPGKEEVKEASVTIQGTTFKDGDYVMWHFNNREIPGRISLHGNPGMPAEFWICQDFEDGNEIPAQFKFGYKYSWVQSKNRKRIDGKLYKRDPDTPAGDASYASITMDGITFRHGDLVRFTTRGTTINGKVAVDPLQTDHFWICQNNVDGALCPAHLKQGYNYAWAIVIGTLKTYNVQLGWTDGRATVSPSEVKMHTPVDSYKSEPRTRSTFILTPIPKLISFDFSEH